MQPPTRPDYFQAAPAGACPRCGKPIVGHPATSRRDNRTAICGVCGAWEAMQAAGNLISDEQAAEVLGLIREQTDQQKGGQA